MKPKVKTVVVDADAIIAQVNTKDENHERAKKIAESLDSSGVKVLYPVTAVTEAVTVMQSKMNSLGTAIDVAEVFARPGYEVVEISQEIYNYAVDKFFSKVSNKRDTMFDCIVASVAEKYKADAVFSFDKFYKRRGFRLVSES